MRRLESVWLGKDGPLLDAMLDFYAPEAARVVDVCCNARRIWKGSTRAPDIVYYDVDPAVKPDVVADWGALPDPASSVDVLIYDPPHVPLAAASANSSSGYWAKFGIGKSVRGSNVVELHPRFLAEARRVLRPDGIVLAKIKDYIHNHKYQWNLELFNQAARSADLTVCDLIIKRDPSRGMISGRWKASHHARNVHVYWVVLRNGRCEPRRRVLQGT